MRRPKCAIVRTGGKLSIEEVQSVESSVDEAGLEALFEHGNDGLVDEYISPQKTSLPFCSFLEGLPSHVVPLLFLPFTTFPLCSFTPLSDHKP